MKKNILVLNYEFPPLGGGASPVSYEISKGYVELGYNVDVITMGYKDLPDFEVLDGMNIYRVKCLRTKKQVCYPWEQLTYIYSGYKKAKELLKTKKYDICHTHFIIPTGVIAKKLKKEFGLDYIITAHGSDVLGHNPKFSLLYKILKNPWKNIIKEAKNIISPSKYLKTSIEKYYGKSDKIIVIPNGIEKDKFKPLKKDLGAPGGGKYILTISRLQKGKAIQDLLEVVKDIDLGDWKIKIVGTGPYEQELKKIVEKNNLKNKVEFVGWVDNRSEKMKELYGKASIFCQPSYFENASIVLLEAMQAGCCLIARNVGGNPETVNEKGLFNNLEELKNKLEFFIKNEEELEKSQKENIEKVKKYEWKEIILEYNKYL